MNDVVARRAVATATGALLVLHALGGGLRTGPAIVADEPGYLFDIRVLAGHGGGPLAGASYYRGGWSLLLVPVELLTSQPMRVFAAALLLNAVLAAAVVPLLYLLLRRQVRAAPGAAAAGAVVAGAYPSLHVLGQAALPEALLAVLVLLVALCVGELARGGGIGWAACLGLLMAYACAVHGRSVGLLAVGLLALLLLLRAGRLRRQSAVAAGLTTALGLLAVALLDRHLRAAAYAGVGGAEVTERLRHLSAVGGLLRALVGQTWYCAVASLGVLPLLAQRWRSLRGQVAVLVTVGTAAAFLALSAISLAVPSRADHLIYGRYIEVALLLPIAFGVSELIRQRPSRREIATAAAGVLALTAVVALLRAGFHPSAGPNRWNVTGLPVAPIGALSAAVLVAAGVVACAVLVVLRLGARPAVGVLLAGFAAVSAYGQLVPVRSGDHAVYGAGWTDPRPLIRPGASVGVTPALQDVFGRYAYPWFVDRPVALTEDATYEFGAPGRQDWRPVWRDARGAVVLYDTGR